MFPNKSIQSNWVAHGLFGSGLGEVISGEVRLDFINDLRGLLEALTKHRIHMKLIIGFRTRF